MMRPRFLAAGVMLGWIASSMVLLIAFRGVPLRLRGMLILASLLVLIAVIGWIKLSRARRK
jgi:hypothetical protein